MIERVAQDIRYAGRLLGRRPAFSVTAIVTLMLGMGGTTAVFSLLDALLMRNLPVAQPEELVRLIERRPDGTSAEAFTLVTQDMLRGSRTLSGVTASARALARPEEIEVSAEKRLAYVQLVSDNYFAVLGVHPHRGRLFQPGATSAGDLVAVISDDYWRRQYQSDLSVLGTRIRRGAREFVVAGITPPGFRGTEVDVPIDIWISIEQVVPLDSIERTQGRWMRIIGRLQAGATVPAAAAEVSALLGRPVQLQPGGLGFSTLRMRLYQPLMLVAVVVALVLLIACANLANLMMAATASRGREFAVRAAIGASRRRIVGQLLTESLLLSMIGVAFGLAVARWTSGVLLAFLPPEQALALPNLRFDLNGSVLGFAAALTCATCLLFGLAPALRLSGRVTAADLRAGGGSGQRTRSWMTRGLLVSQVVMCTALLIVSGVFLRTLQNLRGQDAGYREERLLVADIGFPRAYPENRRDELIEAIVARITAMPAVQHAGFSHSGQLSGGAIEWRIGFPGRTTAEGDQPTVIEQRISPGFLSAMGTSLTLGRDFTAADDERAPLVAIVNESFVRRFLSGQNPIGARFFRQGGSRSGEAMTIVGVVKDAKWINLRTESSAMYYRPYRQMGGTPVVRLAVRTSADVDSLPADLVAIAHSIDRNITLTNVVPFEEIVNRTLVVERLVAHVSTAFGVVALLIAAIGLYGVLAYSVARRRREIGVRIAIGARPGTIQWMLVKESLALLAVGVFLGVPAASIVTRLAASMLFGVSPYDAVSVGVALAVLTAATLGATCVPAQRGARIDPIVALREE